MIIALIGPKGSGKTTLMTHLVKTGKFFTIPFAGTIKRMLKVVLEEQMLSPNAVESMLNGPGKEKPTPYLCGRSPRWAMQTLGTEWRDMIDKNLWVEIWSRKVENMMMGQNIVVDDMRFSHEEQKVRQFGGHVIRINRPSLPDSKDMHLSETEHLRIIADYTVENKENFPMAMFDNLCLYLPELKKWSRQ